MARRQLLPRCPAGNTGVTIRAYPQTSHDFRARAVRNVSGVRCHIGSTHASIKHWDLGDFATRIQGSYDTVLCRCGGGRGGAACPPWSVVPLTDVRLLAEFRLQ